MRIISYLMPYKYISYLALGRPREAEKVDQWIQWHFGFSCFQWNFLGWDSSPPRGKPLCCHTNTTTCIQYMCTHIHVHAHNHTLLLTQFTELCPIRTWSYHISKNTSFFFSAHTWCDLGTSSCTWDPELFLDGGNILVQSRLNMNTSLLQSCVTLTCWLPKWLMICWPVVPVTADCRKNAA